ncbi:MAG: tRNA(His) guanylyltransferase Thg1 family protein [Syntrophobacteraceae bacterium]
MKSDDLDVRMRAYESAHDLRVLPDMFLVARLDGRAFWRLTREVRPFQVPFDPEFRDMMIAATEHLMQGELRVVYGYTQSDEICVVFHRDEGSYGHKLRTLDSALAGEASAKFSLLFGYPASFDCRISQLPNSDVVLDYLEWRFLDAHRNALQLHSYWALRRMGHSKREAAKKAESLSPEEKIEWLRFKAGIEFNELPLWQRRGVGIYWLDVPKDGRDLHADGAQTPLRRRIVHELHLPEAAKYLQFVRQILHKEHMSMRS